MHVNVETACAAAPALYLQVRSCTGSVGSWTWSCHARVHSAQQVKP